MMGIARSAVVCFVIDTTGSMYNDIVEARKLVYEIIDSKKGTQDEPSEYILVPFNDPGKVHSTKILQTIHSFTVSESHLLRGKVIFSLRRMIFVPFMQTLVP